MSCPPAPQSSAPHGALDGSSTSVGSPGPSLSHIWGSPQSPGGKQHLWAQESLVLPSLSAPPRGCSPASYLPVSPDALPVAPPPAPRLHVLHQVRPAQSIPTPAPWQGLLRLSKETSVAQGDQPGVLINCKLSSWKRPYDPLAFAQGGVTATVFALPIQPKQPGRQKV